MAVLSDDMGGITAYAAAVNRGYTGTKEEFEQLMYSYTEVAERAEAAAGNAHESEEASIEAKDIAVGAKNEAVSARDAAVSVRDASISAKNDSQSARDASISAKNDTLAAKDAVMSAKSDVDETSANFSDAVTAAISDVNAAGRNQKELAKTHAIDSEAWAVGQREGADVGVSDETYHNNSKYYAEQSALAKSETETARDTAITAKNDAIAAKNEAETAKGQAQDIVDGINAKSEQIDQNAEDIIALQTAMETKANIDGSYEDLVSGGAYQIISNMEEVDNTPYGYRTAGGSLEIGDREKLKKIVGGSLAVNQLVPDLGTLTSSGSKAFNNGTAKIAGHKYLFSANISADGNTVGLYSKADDVGATEIILNYSAQSAIISAKKTATSDGTNNNSNGNMWLYPYIPNGSISNIMFIDLTAMFGTTIADYIYTLETATAGVAWLKANFPRIFNAGYIPYNAGTLEHVSGLESHDTVGFNQFDEVWESGYWDASDGTAKSSSSWQRNKNAVHCVPGAAYCFTQNGNGTLGYLSYYDANDNFISSLQLSSAVASGGYVYTAPANAHYMRFYRGASASGVPFCINLHWDGELDGEYEPYEEHSYPLDSDVTLRGIPKLDANNNLYYDGDEYVADGTVTRRYGIVDLGTLTWYINATGTNTRLYYANRNDAKPAAGNIVANAVCPFAETKNINELWGDDLKGVGVSGNGVLAVRGAIMEPSEFKTAMSGVYLVYELATPTTEEADTYTEIQNVSNWGTEEFVTTSLVPVGHETAYQPDLRAKIEVAPESPDGDGLYLMKRENGQNSYVAYLGELPSDPTTDGTYTLKCTVASGTATKTWEADT